MIQCRLIINQLIMCGTNCSTLVCVVVISVGQFGLAEGHAWVVNLGQGLETQGLDDSSVSSL